MNKTGTGNIICLKNDSRGMSLVELLVVMAIMVILVGALTPALIKYVEHSRQSKDVKIIDNIRDSLTDALADSNVVDSIPSGTGSYIGNTHVFTDLFDPSQPGYSQSLDKELRSLLTISPNASLTNINDEFTPTSKATRDPATNQPYKVYFYIDRDDSVAVWIGTTTAAVHSKLTDRMFLGGAKDLNISGWNEDGIDNY